MAISGTCTFVDEYGKYHPDTKITSTLTQEGYGDPVITVECDGRECSSIVSEKDRLDNAEGKKINCYKNVQLEKIDEPKPEKEESTPAEAESTEDPAPAEKPSP